MKPRTFAIMGMTAKVSGVLLGLAVMIVAVAETLNGVMCCWASEREG